MWKFIECNQKDQRDKIILIILLRGAYGRGFYWGVKVGSLDNSKNWSEIIYFSYFTEVISPLSYIILTMENIHYH